MHSNGKTRSPGRAGQKMRVATAGAALAACLQTASQTTAQPADLAIAGVHVIDVESGEIARNRTILVEGDRIAAIVAAGQAAEAEAERVVTHGGAFAIPALWDMHVHFRGGQELEAENAVLLTQYLGYGIAGVREAGGDLADAVARWRAEIAAGERLGPAIFTPLLKLDGSGASWPGSIPVENEAGIDVALDWLAARQADYVKIYDSTISPELYIQIIETTELRGMTSAAHLPFSVAFTDAVDAGLDNLEHALYLHKAASPEDAEIAAEIRRARENGDRSGLGNSFRRLLESEDRAHARAVFERMAAAGTALTPTLYIDRLLRHLDEEPHTDDPELAQIPPAIRETYGRRVASATARTPERIAFDHRRVARTMELAALAHEAGVTILAGSDAGPYNSYVYPGDSLHHELAWLVEAGLTPLAALQAATVNGARFLGVAERHGTLETGKMADILILKANPVADITNTRAAAALVRAGQYLPEERLAALRTLDRDD